MKKFFLLAVLAMTVLSACGKYALPEPYPDSGYPHTYPSN